MHHMTRYSCLIIGLCLTQLVLGGQKKDTSVSVGVEASKGGGVRGTVGVSKDLGNGVSFNAGAHVDNKGNRGVKAGFSFRWRRALKEFQRFNVTLLANPCEFDFYDQDMDGNISTAEMSSIFGNTIEAAKLLYALDKGTVDGTITKEEFATFAPIVINDCFRKSF